MVGVGDRQGAAYTELCGLAGCMRDTMLCVWCVWCAGGRWEDRGGGVWWWRRAGRRESLCRAVVSRMGAGGWHG